MTSLEKLLFIYFHTYWSQLIISKISAKMQSVTSVSDHHASTANYENIHKTNHFINESLICRAGLERLRFSFLSFSILCFSNALVRGVPSDHHHIMKYLQHKLKNHHLINTYHQPILNKLRLLEKHRHKVKTHHLIKTEPQQLNKKITTLS